MCSSENINGCDASVWIWHMVINVDGIVNCHGPILDWIFDVQPVNAHVKEHGACHVHDGFDGVLSLAICMMSADTGKVLMLAMYLEIIGEGF